MAIAVLGPLRLRTPRGRIDPRSRVSRRLLAALALSEDNESNADELAAAIWDATAPMSRSALQVAVHRCRQLLAHEGCDDVRIETTATGYRLALGQRATDLRVFTDLTERASADLNSLEAALALWRGPVLSDEPAVAEHFRVKVDALDRQRRAAALALARSAVAAGESARALASLEPLARADALDEELGAAYIEALTSAGRMTDAIAEYRRISAALTEDLGLPPGRGLRASLQRGLTRQHFGAQQPPGPCLLPAPVLDFIGRRLPLQRLIDLMRSGRNTVVVSGAAGVGKTTLAVQASHRMRSLFPGGVLHCNLRGFTRPLAPAEVVARFLRALEIHPAMIPSDLEERAAMLRAKTADTPVLLLADNAGTERQVRPLLPGLSGALLITSRIPLEGLEGAERVELGTFPRDESVALIRTVIGSARAHGHDDVLDVIADYCGDLPLAVRIAAVRLAARPYWPVQRMAGLLADERSRLDELRAGDLDVRAAIELSYRHLSLQERRVLRIVAQLDVPDFPGFVCGAAVGTTAQAGEEIADTLAQAHLLQVTEVDVAGQVRYGMHDLVRRFARERYALEEPVAEYRAAVRRVTTAWLSLAVAADQQLASSPARGMPPFAPAGTALDPVSWFERERISLGAATMHAVDFGAPEICWRLVEASKRYLLVADRAPELSAWAERGLRAATEAGDLVATARMHTVAAEAAHYVNAYEKALQHCEAAAEAFAAVLRQPEQNIAGLAAMLYVSGSVKEQLGRIDAAFLDVLRAARLGHRDGDFVTEGLALTLLGRMLQDYRSGRQALRHLERGIAVLRRSGSSRDLALGLRRLGLWQERTGRVDAAYRTYTECLELVRVIHDREGGAYLRMYLGTLLVDHPELGDAVPHLLFAKEEMSNFDDARGRARISEALARQYLREKEPAKALILLDDALSLASEVPRLRIQALRTSAEAYAALGQLPQAMHACQAALETAQRLGASDEAAAILLQVSGLAHDRDT